MANGYVQDLLPKIKINPNFSHEERIGILDSLNVMINTYQIYLSQFNIHSHKREAMCKSLDTDSKLAIEYKTMLSDVFGIFAQLKVKMKDSKHKQMGHPLKEASMLALLLYCNGECNHDLCLPQRDATYLTKWKIFDCLVDKGIQRLATFEKHYENIYAGICDVFYKFRNDGNDVVHFTTTVTFTRDLNVAKNFRGSSGMIIGLNLQRSFAFVNSQSSACDVSWISKFPNEKEVLCTRGSQIRFYKNKMKETQNENGEKLQSFVCDEGNLQETSFQSMFATQ